MDLSILAIGAGVFAGQYFDPLQALEADYWATDLTSEPVNTADLSENNCNNDPISYDFFDKKSRLRITTSKWEVTAQVLKITSNDENHPMVFIQYDGESRLGPDGKPIVWAMSFLSEDRFVWNAYSSQLNEYLASSRERMRCKKSASS